MALNYHNIDPVLVAIGPLDIRFYSLAYIAGILIGLWYVSFLAKSSKLKLTKKFFEDTIVAVVVGIVTGGKLAYVLFYNPIDLLSRSGFSFHGGLVGVMVSTFIVTKKYKLNYWRVLDLFACAAPIGIFLGRIANFINGELYGRVTNVPWAMYFPTGGYQPRHPSQLYEAGTEGLLLFIIMAVLFFSFRAYKKPGLLTGIGAVLYGAFRICMEFFREPDSNLGYFLGYITMGQILSAALVLFGIYSMWRTRDDSNA